MQKYSVDISGYPAILRDIRDNSLENNTGFKVIKETHFSTKNLLSKTLIFYLLTL